MLAGQLEIYPCCRRASRRGHGPTLHVHVVTGGSFLERGQRGQRGGVESEMTSDGMTRNESNGSNGHLGGRTTRGSMAARPERDPAAVKPANCRVLQGRRYPVVLWALQQRGRTADGRVATAPPPPTCPAASLFGAERPS